VLLETMRILIGVADGYGRHGAWAAEASRIDAIFAPLAEWKSRRAPRCCVRKNGKTILERGYGLNADLRTKAPMAPRPASGLASFEQAVYTARLAVMLLVEDGKLGYERIPAGHPIFAEYGPR